MKADNTQQAEQRQPPRRFIAITAVVIFLSVVAVIRLRKSNIDSPSQLPSHIPVDKADSTDKKFDGEGLAKEGHVPTVDNTDTLDDPVSDGWQTEELTNEANAVLSQLAKLLRNDDAPMPGQLRGFITDSFECDTLLPTELPTIRKSGAIHIQRVQDVNSEQQPAPSPSPLQHQSEAGLAESLNALLTPYRNTSDRHVKIKLYKIKADADSFETVQLFSMSAVAAAGMVEHHATWTIRWRTTNDAPPRMERLTVSNVEQITTQSPSKQLFVDCARSMLEANESYQRQLLRGVDHWVERVPHGIYQELVGTPGIAVGDVNGDGLEDLYLCQERGIPNKLFIQNPDGTLTDQSERWGVNWLDASRAPLLVDLDNDGDQDLALTVMGGVALFANVDQKGFQLKQFVETTEDVMSTAAADYDQDGDLDIYVCGYLKNSKLPQHGNIEYPMAGTGGGEGFVRHDANNGGPNALLRNDINTSSNDDWKFIDVTKDVGLDANNHRFSFGASWEDFDNDGDLDLYIANDFGRDNLYQNNAGKFKDVSEQFQIENAGTGMGITWGDYNRDGWMDAYVSNMFSSAGNRITTQRQFQPDAPAEVKQRLKHSARGNTLLRNNGSKPFSDVSEPLGVAIGRWAWASQLVDLNNDGWEDIVVANGYITSEDTRDL